MKAVNVFIDGRGLGDPKNDDKYSSKVADYESAMLVQGTGFWRALEVLEEFMKQPWDRKEGIWMAKVDAYSYAIMYYEIFTEHISFYGYKEDWKRVIDGKRPHLLDYIDLRV